MNDQANRQFQGCWTVYGDKQRCIPVDVGLRQAMQKPEEREKWSLMMWKNAAAVNNSIPLKSHMQKRMKRMKLHWKKTNSTHLPKSAKFDKFWGLGVLRSSFAGVPHLDFMRCDDVLLACM